MPGIPTPADPNGQTIPPEQFGQFMGGSAMAYSPAPLPETPIQGTGHFVNQGAQFISGLEAGSNFMGNLQESARGAQMYKARQALVPALAKYVGATPAELQDAQQAFTGTPGGQLMRRIGHAVIGLPADLVAGAQAIRNGFQGGGIVPASTKGQLPPNYAPGAGSRAYAGGGVVGPADLPPPSMLPVSVSDIPMPAGPPGADGGAPPPLLAAAMMAQQGAGNGAAPQPFSGNASPSVPMPQSGGPSPTPGLQPGAQQGQAPAAFNAGQVAAKDPGVEGKFEAWASHLFRGGVNPGGKGVLSLPTQAATSPTPGSLATAGSPGSLDAHWFEQGDRLAVQAALAAGYAGADPLEVYNALQNQRTGYLQSHFLRALSGANAALEAGDQKGAVEAMRQAYRYVPDGQDLNFKTVNGNVMFEDPFAQDARGNMTTALRPLNLQTVGAIGQAALDPTAFSGYINGVRIATMGAQAKLDTGLGQLARGQGIYASGHGAELRALAERARVPYQNLLDQYQAKLDAARATIAQGLVGTFGATLNPQVRANVGAAVSLAQQTLLGPKTTVPLSQSDPLGPKPGTVVRDSSQIPRYLQHLSAEDQNSFSVYAAGFAAEGMSAPQAVHLAMQVFQLRGQTHPAADDPSAYAKAYPNGKVPDVLVDPKAGVIHFWQPAQSTRGRPRGGHWASVRYNPSGRAFFSAGGGYERAMSAVFGPDYGAPVEQPGNAQSTTALDASYGSGSAP